MFGYFHEQQCLIELGFWLCLETIEGKVKEIDLKLIISLILIHINIK